MHPRLVKFFNGAMTELRGAYEKSEGAPTACAGSLREGGIRRSIEHSLPSIVRLYDGEIIDPFGGHSGQLDGIVVHATGAALASSPTEPRVALAEGVLAVIESKSDIAGQWDKEVLRTWEKVRKLRRFDPTMQGIWTFGQPHPSDRAIPFFVMGRTGWKKPETLRDKALELHESFGDAHAPLILILQVDPPGLGMVWWEGNEAKRVGAIANHEDERWRPLASLWSMLTQRAQTIMHTPINWQAYFEIPNPS